MKDFFKGETQLSGSSVLGLDLPMRHGRDIIALIWPCIVFSVLENT